MFFFRVLIMYDYVQCLIHFGSLLNRLWKLFPWIDICDNTFNISFSALYDCHNITHILREISTSQVSPNADIALPNICNAFALRFPLPLLQISNFFRRNFIWNRIDSLSKLRIRNQNIF